MKTTQLSSLIAVPMFMLLTGCGLQSLSPLVKNFGSSNGLASLDAHVCTSEPNPAEQNLKYLFILDHSGSNKPAISGSTDDVNNTDPTGSRRYGPLVNFVNNLNPVSSTHTTFGLIDFNGDASNPVDYSVTPNGRMTTFEPATAFVPNITKDWIGGGSATATSPNDSGFTDYVNALSKAKDMITADISGRINVVKTSYVIIFVSDGVPTLQSGATQTYMSDIGPALQAILNLKNNTSFGKYISTITLNTAYYYLDGHSSSAAISLLSQMATDGGGQQINFESGRNVLYEQFAPTTRNLPNSLVDIFVENKNLVWWDDGRLLADSDGDGLPDAIEAQFGSNASLADSDGNGVNDLVEYRMKGKPCNSLTCAAAARDTYSSCLGFSHSTSTDGRVTFVETAGDGLNDCEKFTLGASSDTFNTNGNFIPDELAFRYGLPIVPGTDQDAYLDIFSNGINNYNKLKQALPIKVSLASLLSYTPQTTLVTPESTSPNGVSCYHVQVNNIPMAFGSNTIRMMVVQNKSALEDTPFMTSASVVMPDGTHSASFSSGDFK